MKIGIMTFHWATNHGAILQAFALQNFLQKNNPDCEVMIIDYYPNKYFKGWSSVFRSLNPKAILKNYREYRKERLLCDFRLKLKKTEHYSTTEKLNMYASDFDVVICGSDQVWNEFYTLNGEGDVTTAYYLSFCPKSKKISYAASFGFEHMKDELKKITYPLLKDFYAVSVRECSAIKILNDMNINSKLVCDPTCLMDRKFYEEYAKYDVQGDFVAKYILRKQNKQTNDIISKLIYNVEEKNIIDLEKLGIEGWLGAISNAKCCITNSFHCSVFSIIFHTPFYVILETNKRTGMNDRFITLLKELGLSNRIVESELMIDDVVNSDIDWDYVDNKLQIIRQASGDFLITNCFGNDNDDKNM